MRRYKNPVIMYDKTDRNITADPYVLRYNGMYYHCYMKEDGIYLSESEELWNIGSGRKVKVFDNVPGARKWYAPELHRIGDSWYIYGAPNIDNRDMHCMCVLELKGESPIGAYENKGVVRGLENKWSLDGTILEYEGKIWFVWADCGHIFMAEMENPYGIKGETVVLANCGEMEFEKRDGRIIEGPAILKKEDKIHIVFSANNSQNDEYCLGRLTYCGGDIADSANWKKHPEAIFEKTDKVFGPGHCSFTTVTEDGCEKDYIVYHANLESGSGWYGRNVFVQEFTWDSDNNPVFGKPEI